MISIETAFQKLITEGAGSLSNEELCCLLRLTAAEIATLAEANGEAADYTIESIIEAASERKELLFSEKERVRNYWMELTEVPGGTHLEIVVRCAEFLAKHLCEADPGINDLHHLATSREWKQRLIAAWYVRNKEGDEENRIKELLAADPFEDENGFFLVREGTGLHEE